MGLIVDPPSSFAGCVDSEESPMNEVAIRLHVEPLEEGGFLATSPDVPGLVAEGRSVSEAVEIA